MEVSRKHGDFPGISPYLTVSQAAAIISHNIVANDSLIAVILLLLFISQTKFVWFDTQSRQTSGSLLHVGVMGILQLLVVQ